MKRRRELDDIALMAAIAVATLIGIVLGCWLGDVLGLVF